MQYCGVYMLSAVGYVHGMMQGYFLRAYANEMNYMYSSALGNVVDCIEFI